MCMFPRDTQTEGAITSDGGACIEFGYALRTGPDGNTGQGQLFTRIPNTGSNCTRFTYNYLIDNKTLQVGEHSALS